MVRGIRGLLERGVLVAKDTSGSAGRRRRLAAFEFNLRVHTALSVSSCTI